jgi:uncharacterized protein
VSADTVARAVAILERGATEHARRSDLHGVGHWKRVALAAHYLEAPDADMLVVLLFAMIHDSQRHNDDHDPLHGPRAAAFALEFADLVDEAQLRVLSEACAEHASGGLSTDPTIAVCFDADRLNLWRVGIAPSPAFMSTEAGRRPATITWASELQGAPLPSWEQLGARLL